MNKLLIALVMVLICGVANAGQWDSFTALTSQVVSSTTGTVVQIKELSEPYSKISCDFVSSSATHTGYFNALYSATSSTPFYSAASLFSSTSKTAGSVVTANATDKIFRNIAFSYWMPVGVTSNTVRIDCIVIK